MTTLQYRFAVHLKIQYEESKRLLKKAPHQKKDNTSIIGINKNAFAYYPDTSQVIFVVPRSVLPRQFYFFIFVMRWVSRNKAGYYFRNTVEAYYCHSFGVVSGDFMLPKLLAIELGFMNPFGIERKKEYITRILKMSFWKPSFRPNPISKHDALNLSLEVIDYKTSKKKKPKKTEQSGESAEPKVKMFSHDPDAIVDEKTGRRINRKESPTLVIHLFIRIPDNITETSLYFSFVTGVIKSINQWFITHSNTFYEQYLITLKIRLIYDHKRPSQSVDSNNPFVRTNHYGYIQNKFNYTLLNKLKDFEFTVLQQIERIKNTKTSDLSKSDYILNTFLETYIREIVPHLNRPPSLISLLPFPSDKTLPFYNELFSQGLKEISSRVRKPSKVTLSSIKLFSISAPFNYEDNLTILPPVFRVGREVDYNRNLFLFLSEKEFYDIVDTIKNNSRKARLTKEKPNVIAVKLPNDKKS